MLSIYIAGPYTKPDPAVNVNRAMKFWHRLADVGLYPYCPHLTHFLHLSDPQPYEEWLRHDFYWLTKCDIFIRMFGESAGADREQSLAERLGKPVLCAPTINTTDDMLIEFLIGYLNNAPNPVDRH